MLELSVGMKAKIEIVVKTEDLASHVGSGMVDVFATPKMIALMEQAASKAVAGSLAPGEVTVGTKIHVTHQSATPLGMKVTAEAELIGINGKTLDFLVKAFDERILIGEGEHQRYIVNAEKFSARAANK